MTTAFFPLNLGSPPCPQHPGPNLPGLIWRLRSVNPDTLPPLTRLRSSMLRQASLVSLPPGPCPPAPSANPDPPTPPPLPHLRSSLWRRAPSDGSRGPKCAAQPVRARARPHHRPPPPTARSAAARPPAAARPGPTAAKKRRRKAGARCPLHRLLHRMGPAGAGAAVIHAPAGPAQPHWPATSTWWLSSMWHRPRLAGAAWPPAAPPAAPSSRRRTPCDPCGCCLPRAQRGRQWPPPLLLAGLRRPSGYTPRSLNPTPAM